MGAVLIHLQLQLLLLLLLKVMVAIADVHKRLWVFGRLVELQLPAQAWLLRMLVRMVFSFFLVVAVVDFNWFERTLLHVITFH